MKKNFLLAFTVVLLMLFTGCNFLTANKEDEKEAEPEWLSFTGTALTAAGTVNVDMGGGNTATFNLVKFGDWPQTIMASNVTIDKSKATKAGLFTYYKGSDGAWYYECKETGKSYTNKLHYTDGTEVKRGGDSTRWFKVEPIVWRVITNDYNSSGKKLLIAEKVLINTAFYDYTVNRNINGETIYPNNYEHSRVRAFLNGNNYMKQEKEDASLENDETFVDNGFLQTAFTTELQNAIHTTAVINDADSAKPKVNYYSNSYVNNYVFNKTLNDKVFLLSQQEATDYDYGFAYDMYSTNPSVYRFATDFAKASGTVPANQSPYATDWWLRSPYDMQPYYVSLNTNYCNVNLSTQGIIPALCLEN